MRSRSRARDRSTGEKRLVGFFVGDVQYALEIERVREIMNPTTVSGLPQMPAAVVGVADHRGEVVPIVDARKHFGLPPAPASRSTKWILLGAGGQFLGLVVDGVTEVFGSTAPPREPPAALGSSAQRGVSWVATRGTQMVFVLDVDRLTALVVDFPGAVSAWPASGSDRPSEAAPGGEVPRAPKAGALGPGSR